LKSTTRPGRLRVYLSDLTFIGWLHDAYQYAERGVIYFIRQEPVHLGGDPPKLSDLVAEHARLIVMRLPSGECVGVAPDELHMRKCRSFTPSPPLWPHTEVLRVR
jgi:hypothetical protein